MRDALCQCTKAYHHCDCTVHGEAEALVEERDRLRAAIDMIAESVMTQVTVLKGQADVEWGCGICQGVYLGRDMPDGKGVYKHENWCPRK